MTVCKAKARNGKRCRAPAGKSGYCFTHDPRQARARAAAHRKGGRARAYGDLRPADDSPLGSPADVLAGLQRTVTATWKQDNTATRSRALIAGYLGALHAFEVGELEKRVEALAAALEEHEKKIVQMQRERVAT